MAYRLQHIHSWSKNTIDACDLMVEAITTIIGTRPEIIKMSRLVPLLDKKFDHSFIFSGQHYSENMVDIFFEELNVRKPDHFLGVRSSEYFDLMPPMTKKLGKINSDCVLVYGDTNSTLAAALATKKLGKKLIHVEAGLRSFDKRMLEEFNRILTDHISDYLFTPTKYTEKLLERESLTKNVFAVGNTIVDAVYAYKPKAEKSKILDELGVKSEDYFVLTLHRSELVDNPVDFKKVIRALGSVGNKIIFPVHPRTEKNLSKFGVKLPKNIISTKPLGYFEFLKLLKEATLVMTDSGGVQEEAITLKVPCLTLMQCTERMETIEIGMNFLVGYDENKIKNGIDKILRGDLKENIKNLNNPYGDGNTSKKIIDILSL